MMAIASPVHASNSAHVARLTHARDSGGIDAYGAPGMHERAQSSSSAPRG